MFQGHLVFHFTMASNLEIFSEKLNAILKEEFKGLYFSLPISSPAKNMISPRLVYIEEGMPYIQMGREGCAENKEIQAGALLYAVPNAPSGLSSASVKCRTFALNFEAKGLRVVSYTFRGDNMPPDIIYCDKLSGVPSVAWMMLDTLNRLAFEPEYSDCASTIVRALFQMALHVIENAEKTTNLRKSQASWLKISNYIEANLKEELSRRSIAARFKINQCYLSSLCHKMTGSTFVEFVRDKRLAKAMLLLELELSLDEISEACGYRYTSYFIRQFKEKYGLPPGTFRLQRMNIKANIVQ